MIRFILEAKVILKKMVHRIISNFIQCTDIFNKVIGVCSGNYIYFWNSKGLSDENIRAPTTIHYSLNPQLGYCGTETRLEF